jgi:hypothetical protein
VFISDHCPTYVDFDPSILFRDITSNIALASRRGLQVQDPCIISSYHEHLRKQLDYHNLPAKIQALQDAASSTTPSPDLSTQYDKIDRLLTESMLCAKRLSSKRYSTKFQWSPALSLAVSEVRYWRLRMKQLKGILISPHTLQKAAEEAKIAPSDTSLHSTQILSKLRDAHKKLREYQLRRGASEIPCSG